MYDTSVLDLVLLIFDYHMTLLDCSLRDSSCVRVWISFKIYNTGVLDLVLSHFYIIPAVLDITGVLDSVPFTLFAYMTGVG